MKREPYIDLHKCNGTNRNINQNQIGFVNPLDGDGRFALIKDVGTQDLFNMTAGLMF